MRYQQSILLAALTLVALSVDALPTMAQRNASHPEIILSAPPDQVMLGGSLDTDGTTLAALTGGLTQPVDIWVRTPEAPGWALQEVVPIDADNVNCVAVSGERIYLGCRDFSPPRNYVIVLHRSGERWLTEAVVEASDGLATGQFATSVAAGDSTLVVGDVGEGMQVGAVYVFQRSGSSWTQVARLEPADPLEIGVMFGQSVALSGDTLAVGIPEMLGPGGAVYVFVGDGASWTQQAKLVANGLGNMAFLGSAVSVEGDTLVAGAPGAIDTGGNQTGAAVVFQRLDGTWSAGTVLPSPPQSGGLSEYVGQSVSIVGGLVACGAPYASSDLGVEGTGAVQLFRQVGGVWTLLDVLHSDAVVPWAELGLGVDIAGQRVFGSAPWDAGGGTIHGFWVGGPEPEIWIDLGYGLAGVAGVPQLEGTGTLQIGAPGALTLTEAAHDALCLGLVSLTVTPTPFRGGTFVAVPAQAQLLGVTDALGQIELSWSAVPPETPMGMVFITQFAVVDPSAPVGVALSNALAGVIQS